MSDKRVTDLTSYTTPIDADVFPVVDTVGEATKKITLSNLIGAVGPTVTVGRSNAQYLCDGTDDNVQIQQAIDAVNAAGGGTVFIKAGTYSFTSNPTGATVLAKTYLNNGGDGLTIKGEGMGRTIINVTQNITAPSNFFWSHGYDYVTISDLSIIGDGIIGNASSGGYGGHAIMFDGGDYFTLERCRILNFEQNEVELSVNRGLGLDGGISNWIKIKDNIFMTLVNANISTSQCRRMWIENNYFSNIDTPISIGGASQEDVYEIYVRNNIFDTYGQAGMPTVVQTTMGLTIAFSYNNISMHDIYITDNIFYPAFTSPIFLTGTSGLTGCEFFNIFIDRNVIHGGGMGVTGNGLGIHLDNSYDNLSIMDNISVSENRIYKSGGNAIRLTSMTNVKVNNNQILDCITGNGIGLEGCSYIQIHGNKVTDGICHGIRTYTAACHHLDIKNNFIIRNTLWGMYLNDLNDSDISGNHVIDNDYLDTDGYPGIGLTGDSDNNYFHGNKCHVTTAATYQTYGIYIVNNTCDNNIVSFNDLVQGGSAGGYLDGGTGTSADHNYT